jgi:hypothetical protein
LVLDQGVPRDAASRFRELGYECTHVGEIEMWNAADNEILNWALKTGAVVVTLDADFHTILAVSGASGTFGYPPPNPRLASGGNGGTDSAGSRQIWRRLEKGSTGHRQSAQDHMPHPTYWELT